MKHFANYVDIYPESVVSSIVGTTITTSDGSEADRIRAFSNVELVETPGNQNGNIFYEQSTRIVTSEKMSDELRGKYGNNRPVVVLLYDDQGNAMVWGDGEKARMLITPNFENDVLVISRKSVEPVL